MKTETPSVKIVAITADEAGQRIDNFLRTQLKGVPKSMIYRILRKGEVRVNKKRIKPEYKLEAGDEVRIPPVRVAEREEEAVSPHLQKVAALAESQGASLYEIIRNADLFRLLAAGFRGVQPHHLGNEGVVEKRLDGLAALVKLGFQLRRRQTAHVVGLIVQGGDDVHVLEEIGDDVHILGKWRSHLIPLPPFH